MAHALRYFCSWETEVYKHQMRLELWEKDYVGEATAMVLSGEPQLTMEEGDTICGSSLDFGLFSETNGQYLHLYTTDNHKYLIKILRDSAVMWEGYLLPEYYSEAYIAAPYTVNFTATDWLGMLKNIDFPAEDARVPILQIIKTCLQYTELPLDFACQMELRVEGINDTTNVLGALYLNPITFNGYNCYEVLEKILAAFNATLRQMGHRWLISSIDDEVPLRLISWDSLSYTGDGQSNNGELIGTNFAGTFIDGSMTMAIEPAKKSVDLSQDVFYRESWLEDYDFLKADSWKIEKINSSSRDDLVLPGTYKSVDGLEESVIDYIILPQGWYYSSGDATLYSISQSLSIEGIPNDDEFSLGIKYLTPHWKESTNNIPILKVYVSIVSETGETAWLSPKGWVNTESYIELQTTSDTPKYKSLKDYKPGRYQRKILDKTDWPTTKINFISLPYSGTLNIKLENIPSTTEFDNDIHIGGVYLTKTNITKNISLIASLNPDAAETASSVNLMLCDSPEERNVELGVLNYFSLSNGALTTGKKWYYNSQEYEDFLHAMAYSYSRCYANKRQKLSGALYTDKIYNLCSFTDKWSGKRHTIKSWTYSIISERLDSMEIIETPAKEIELTLSTPEAGSSNKQNQPSGGTSGGGSTSMAGSGRYVNLDTAQEVSGEKTWNDNANFKKNINVAGDGIFGGEVVAIIGEGTPAGVTDYSALTGKPSINGKELASGNNTLDALGIQAKGDYTTATQLTATLADYATKIFVSNNYATKAAVNAIQALIPATATADNQLADKDFVNSSIATATAEFRGSFTSLDELKATSGNLNDYAFYLHTDSVGNSIVDRYKWTTAGWLYEYTLNNSSFTAEQWAALNSTITATLVQSYNSHLNNSTIHITSAERTAWNNKWDYNEDTIKAVKVNAAVSADYATNADKLNGYKASQVVTATISDSIDLNEISVPNILRLDIANPNLPSGTFSYGNLLTVRYPAADTAWQLLGSYSSDALWFRRGSWHADGTGSLRTNAWKVIAFTDSNVASATKLQDNTAFTAWGQTFFENGKPKNASGDLEDVGNITASGKATIQGNIICGGEVVAVAGEGTPAGVTDYSALTGKPQINGVTLVSGNNTLAALGIQAAGDYATNSGVTTLLANYADKTFVSNNYAGKSAFNSHTADSVIHVTSAERTAWNAKWDYNEATIKAVKVTSASSADSVAWSGISDKPSSLKNPYALTFGSKTYDGSAAATITASDLGALTAHQTIYALTLKVNGTSQGVYNPASAAKTINIAVPTKTSDITNDSGFITSASIPTALKNPYAVEIKANGVSLGTYDGSKAATFNLSAANVGAANKIHTHTASEISGLPTKLSAFTNDVGFITGITKSMVEGVLTGNITSHTHTFASLTSKPTTIAGYGITDAITTGNIGSQSVNYANSAGDADTLDGYHATQLLTSIHSTEDLNEISRARIDRLSDINPNLPSNIFQYGNLLTVKANGADTAWQLLGAYNSDNLWFRRGSWYADGTGSLRTNAWKVIAFTDSNVASATKLQTPRTIWGQSFDGTGNIDGTITTSTSQSNFNTIFTKYHRAASLFCKDLESGHNIQIVIGREDNYRNCGYLSFHYNSNGSQTNFMQFGLYGVDDVLNITGGGNVLIGTATDNGYKLQVNGSERVYGDLIVDGEVSALVA